MLKNWMGHFFYIGRASGQVCNQLFFISALYHGGDLRLSLLCRC